MGSLVGEESDQFKTLLKKAEGYMSTPWLQKSIGDSEVAEALGNAYDSDVVAAVTMINQISAILASGTKGNPRNVKRFLNSLTLRLAVAKERGFESAIDSQVLAKIMLAEQFFPDVFEEIAREVGTSPDGISPSLQRLEQRCDKTAKPAESAKTESDASDQAEPIAPVANRAGA